MPERVYMNKIPAEARVHVELTASDLASILTDLVVPPVASPQTRALMHILLDDHAFFAAQAGAAAGPCPRHPHAPVVSRICSACRLEQADVLATQQEIL